MDANNQINPKVEAQQQGAARFKQMHRVVQQVLLLAAFVLSNTLNALGLPPTISDMIFLHSGDQWTGVIPHFFQVRCALLDGRLISRCRSCW